MQAFHTLFHTDDSVLLGAPTGSGKTISSELTMMRLWDAHPGDKVCGVEGAASVALLEIQNVDELVTNGYKWILSNKAVHTGCIGKSDRELCDVLSDIVILQSICGTDFAGGWSVQSEMGVSERGVRHQSCCCCHCCDMGKGVNSHRYQNMHSRVVIAAAVRCCVCWYR